MQAFSPDSVLSMSRAFMESRILLTAAELDLFTVLEHAPMTLPEITKKTKTQAHGMAILLDALSALGLLEKKDGRYLCPPNVAAILSSQAPESVLPMVMHSVGLWRRWSNLTEIVQKGSPVRVAARFEEEGQMEAFIQAMHVVGRRLAGAVVAAIKPGNAKKLLDVGGATGTYTEAFLRAAPEMRATLFDRPDVIEMARRRLSDSGLLDRMTLVSGDFYEDELPGGHDLALLSAIIHQNDRKQNTELYRKVYGSLGPGGRIVIRDHVLSPDRTAPVSGAIFAVNMLAATPGGNSYAFADIREGLEAAGFERVHLIQPDERMNGLVEGFKPEA